MGKKILISVNDLTSIQKFASALIAMGWQIVASKETVEELHKCGIEAEDVAAFTNCYEDYEFPPTLHPKIETALTMDVSYRIDLVYDIPYPYEKGNDIGGRTLLALGAKGNRIVVFTPADMSKVIEELKQDANHTSISANYRKELIEKAYAHIADHYMFLAHKYGDGRFDGLIGWRSLRLMNGENPYQFPSDLYVSKEADSQLRLKSGDTPCFTNLADIDCILHTLCLVSTSFKLKYGKIPYITIVSKHGNPCGMAIDWDNPDKTINNALFGNPQAVWGGECIVNFKIDDDLARLLYKNKKRGELFNNAHWMLDVIISPGFDPKAIEILGKRSSRKLFESAGLYEPRFPDVKWQYRQVRGGFLRQPFPDYVLDLVETEYDISGLDDQIIDNLIIAWGVAYSSYHGGNEVTLVNGRKLLGSGGGPSTVEAAKTAILRAISCGHDTNESVFAADAFFPFDDVPKLLDEAGCKYGVVPAGGKNELLVRDYFKGKNINVLYIPSQFRGFYRH